jgi:hypothetical protein
MTTMTETNLDELVKIYLTIRTEREKLESDWKVRDTEFKNEQALLEQQMLAVCNESNATSIKTEEGTVIKTLKERFTLSDRDSFNKFVRENDAVELFEARLHQGNFKDFMAEHAEDGMPPGVNVMREFTIVVRKPTSKV